MNNGLDPNNNRQTTVVVPPREIPGSILTEAELELREVKARQREAAAIAAATSGLWARPWCAAAAGALVCFVVDIYEHPTNVYVWVVAGILLFAALGFGIVDAMSVGKRFKSSYKAPQEIGRGGILGLGSK